MTFLGLVRTLIVGCGYLGLAVAKRLVAGGHQVFGLRRSPDGSSDLLQEGITPLVADIATSSTLAPLPRDFEWVVNTVSSSKGGAEEYRQVYLTGTRNLGLWLRDQPLAKYVYTSSTSVYGQTDGSEVTESSPTTPKGETSQLLVETESMLFQRAREGGFPAIVLRLSGIYGPGRGHLFHQFVAGLATLSGDGSRLLNMIHRDDAATAIVATLERGQAGEAYNVTDNFPVSQREFLEFLASSLNRPLPPAVTEPATGRKRAVTHKRVSNAKLRESLGWSPQYPTYREGYADEITQALRAENRG
ncbi:MAG TPA: SDR family oxidoreductase [Candidatus Limnocylindria bacterium]|nr:SDR family oxidoreductase [Candidatus Limnocylindria bacterium]